jgi:hypothetical protein
VIVGAKLKSAAPVFCVSVAQPTIDYLVDRLGFTLVGSAGDPPAWASLVRDQMEIMVVCGAHPPPAQDWAAYIYVAGVDELYAEFQRRGADLVGPPQDKPYNNREFEVRMPDGRLVAFGG